MGPRRFRNGAQSTNCAGGGRGGDDRELRRAGVREGGWGHRRGLARRCNASVRQFDAVLARAAAAREGHVRGAAALAVAGSTPIARAHGHGVPRPATAHLVRARGPKQRPLTAVTMTGECHGPGVMGRPVRSARVRARPSPAQTMMCGPARRAPRRRVTGARCCGATCPALALRRARVVAKLQLARLVLRGGRGHACVRLIRRRAGPPRRASESGKGCRGAKIYV